MTGHDTATIPVVDLAAFDDPGRVGQAAAHLDLACREVGFLALVGHGVDDDVVDDLAQSALAFFDLPADEKLAVAMPEPGYPYGYNPIEAEALNRSLGGQAPPDLKETFNVGPIDPPPRPLDEMTDPDERAVHAPNRWPARPADLRPAVERYYRTMSDVAARLMGAMALALGLEREWFAPFVDRHGSALRLAHYPALAGTPPDGAWRAGAHTDYGTLTILWTDGEPGLQVQAVDGTWTDVTVPAGAFVVNLGDLLARWTNDRWRSTMHRVAVVDPARRRLSVPFFHNANWDALVECITDDEPARHEPVLAGPHLMSKFRSTVM